MNHSVQPSLSPGFRRAYELAFGDCVRTGKPEAAPVTDAGPVSTAGLAALAELHQLVLQSAPQADREAFGRAEHFFLETVRVWVNSGHDDLVCPEALQRLAGGVAHHFNTLLTVIESNLHAIRRCESVEDASSPLRAAQAASAQMAAIARQLLAFSGQQFVAPQRVLLDRFLEEQAAALRRLLGSSAQLRIQTLPGVEVLADPKQLEEIVRALVLNARDAMPSGGEVSIRVEAGPAASVNVAAGTSAAAIQASSQASVALVIQDTGTGFSGGCALLFEPFYTTRQEAGRIGLGLSAVWGAVRQLGGHLQLSSGETGVTARLVLPVRAGAEPSLEAVPPGGEPFAAQPQTILLVEDYAPGRNAMRQVLESAGYRVLECATGPEGLRLGLRPQQEVDLLITDMVMTDITGIELARKLRAQRPSLRVLLVSGHESEWFDEVGPEPNMDFLQKPFRPDALLCKVRELLSQQ